MVKDYRKKIIKIYKDRGLKEITFTSRGGQGGALAAEILVSSFIKEGKYANVNMTTTGERRMNPVLNYIKVADKLPLYNCRNYFPSELMIFEESLFNVSTPIIRESIQSIEKGVLMINTAQHPDQLEFPYDFVGKIGTVDATGICEKILGITPPPFGLTFLGLYAKTTQALKLETILSSIMERFPGSLGKKNAEAAKIAFETGLVTEHRGIRGSRKRVRYHPTPLDKVEELQVFQRDPLPGFSKGNPYIWRDRIPVCDGRKCMDCTSQCMVTACCPEGVGYFSGKYLVDHEYCKGCGICSQECPHHAIEMVRPAGVTTRSV